MKSLAKDISMRYVVHALQVVQDMTCKETQLHKHVVLKPETDSTELIVKVKVISKSNVCLYIFIMGTQIILLCLN